MNVSLVQNPDILGSLAFKKSKKIHVGFALETENVMAAAKKKMLDKKLDIIVANNPTQRGVEFGSDFNKAAILVKGKKPIELPLMTKLELAHKIIDELAGLFKGKRK